MNSIVNLTFHLEDTIVGNPSGEQVRDIPDFVETHMSYDEFIRKLIREISDNARSRFDEVPRLNSSINAPAVEIAWIEMMKAHLYNMIPSTLVNATLLIEAAMKEQLTRKLPNENSEKIEGSSFFVSLTNLKPHVTLTKEERKELVGFNDFERNAFIHQKTLKLLKEKHTQIVNVKKIELDTGEENTMDVPLESVRVLWPVLKRRVEKEMVLETMEKAVRLTNRILVTT